VQDVGGVRDRFAIGGHEHGNGPAAPGPARGHDMDELEVGLLDV
jgi:hypothetical protein